MSWVKEALWLPEGVKDWRDTDELPLLIVADRENWHLVHLEVEGEAPSYPVRLAVVGEALYGIRIRGYEFRHHNRDRHRGVGRDERYHLWLQHLECRVAPRRS